MEHHNNVYPPISNQDRETPITLYISTTNDPAKLLCASFDIANQKILNNYFIKNIDGFFSKGFCDLVNVFVFNMFETQDPPNFVRELERQESIISILRKHGAPYKFMRIEEIFGTTILMNAEVGFEIGEIVLCICVIINELMVLELKRKPGGFIILERRDVKCENKRNYDSLKSQILGNSKPTKIFVSPVLCNSNTSLTNLVKNEILKNEDNVISVEYEYEKSTLKFLLAVVGYMHDKLINEWHIFPRCHSSYAISECVLPGTKEDALIVTAENECLPLVKSCLIPRGSNSTLYLSYLNDQNKKYEKVREFDPLESTNLDYHKIKITFIIDENNMPFLYQEKYILPEIEGLPLVLNEKPDFDIPVIAFFDNSAVICVKQENKYKFLDSWNGKYGNDIFLSFHQEKPVLVTDLNASNQCNKTVLKACDIFKVMSMPCENIIPEKAWNFEIKSDDENPVLFRFKHFDDTFALATPAFLMALIVKELLRIIRTEIGVKPKKIGIMHLNKFDETAKKKRITCQLQEACSLLKVDCEIL